MISLDLRVPVVGQTSGLLNRMLLLQDGPRAARISVTVERKRQRFGIPRRQGRVRRLRDLRLRRLRNWLFGAWIWRSGLLGPGSSRIHSIIVVDFHWPEQWSPLDPRRAVLKFNLRTLVPLGQFSFESCLRLFRPGLRLLGSDYSSPAQSFP